uniref:Secreted protein n=1 Tax=Catharus ustulatus TaxID=91951 RepID=A0A8C3UDV7_CATUS
MRLVALFFRIKFISASSCVHHRSHQPIKGVDTHTHEQRHKGRWRYLVRDPSSPREASTPGSR